MVGQSLPLIQISSPSPLTLEILLLQTRVCLDLIDGGYYSRCVDDHVQMLLTKVGNSDGPHFAVAVLVDIYNCLPGLNDARSVGVNKHL